MIITFIYPASMTTNEVVAIRRALEDAHVVVADCVIVDERTPSVVNISKMVQDLPTALTLLTPRTPPNHIERPYGKNYRRRK